MTIDILKSAQKAVQDNSTYVLTGVAVSGVVTTSYLTATASFKAVGFIYAEETKKGKFLAVWKLYVPAGISGALTIACIISANRIGTKKAAAAYSLLSVTEHAFMEYRDKVVETIGANKEQKIKDEIATDRMSRDTPPANIAVIGTGQVLCYEMYAGRYFNCDMETLRKAVNQVNARMLREGDAKLDDFYDLVGLPSTSNSDYVGWDSDKLLDLKFSTVLSADGRPCITFEYNYVKGV